MIFSCARKIFVHEKLFKKTIIKLKLNTMKTLKTKISILTITLFASSILFISCSKKDEPVPVAKVYQEENFLDTYLALTQFNQNTSNVNTGSVEIGPEFTPLVTGKITSLKVKLPTVNTTLRITLWDKSAGTILKTETVNIATANTLLTFDISDIGLIKNKSYILSVNSTNFYQRTKTNNSDAIYPVIAGNIRIDGIKGLAGTNQIIPSISFLNLYLGDFSFNFQQTE
jgi:hypothetical protein